MGFAKGIANGRTPFGDAAPHRPTFEEKQLSRIGGFLRMCASDSPAAVHEFPPERPALARRLLLVLTRRYHVDPNEAH